MSSAIDLFCGAGGLSLGLIKAGFSVIAAIENDSLACETYRSNHPLTRLYNNDINQVNPKTVLKELGLAKGELGLLAGCPPCQSFSRLKTLNGTVRNRDPAKNLVRTFSEFVVAIHPKCVLFENVPGVVKSNQFRDLVKTLRSLEYKIAFEVLNARDYGVAQNRKRLVLLASRLGDPKIAKPSSKKFTVKQAFSKLKKSGLKSDPLHNYPQNRSEKIKSLIRAIPKNGGSRIDLPEELVLECHKKTTGFRDVYGRMNWDEPSPTITGGCINPSRGRFLHPTEDRAITLREAATLQGFPQSYTFSLTKGYHSAAQLVGNAFPPDFVLPQAKELMDLIVAE